MTHAVAKRRVTARKSLTARIKRCWPLYIFLLPPVLYILIFHYYPMYGAQIAFRDFKPLKGILGSDWVGFKHFIKFFNDYQFTRILANTLTISLYGMLASFPVTIVVALMMNAVVNERFKKAVQMISYMPHFISTVVIVGIMLQIFNPRIGIVGQVARGMGIEYRDPLSMPSAFAHMYVWSGIWQSVGWWTIIYIAALAGVDPSHHEAAIIDGASRFQRLLHIELPALLPTASIILIMNAGSMMNLGFEKVYLMQNNLNLSASEVISTYVYKKSLGSTGKTDFSYSTAIGLFNSAVNFILVVTVNQFSKFMKQNTLW